MNRQKNTKDKYIILSLLAVIAIVVIFLAVTLPNTPSIFYNGDNDENPDLNPNQNGNTNPINPTKLIAQPTSINWGYPTLNRSTTRKVMLINNGNTPYKKLHMTIHNVKGLTDYTCTWDFEGQTLSPGCAISVYFTLITHEPPAIDFSFDILISNILEIKTGT